jgi:hypothetical protein
MGRALADVWTLDLHADILTLLRERRDARAAGAYAYTLRDFVQQKPPLVDLADLITDWQGDSELARGFLHYALVVGIDAALATGRTDVARRAHEAAAWIAEPALEPDHHVRGTGWVNPLEDPEVAAALQKALHPEPGPQVRPQTAKTEEGLATKSAEHAKTESEPTRAPAARASRATAEKSTPKPEAKSAAKSKAKSVAKTKAKSMAKPKARPVAKPKAKSVAKPKAKSAAKLKPKPAAKPKSKSKAKPKTKPKAKPKR